MFKISLRKLTATAMLTALSIILERIITITPPSNTLDIRITFGNVPIILAGLLVSPVMGALCGLISDLIGCIISGYPPFPILMLAPIFTGFLPGFIVNTAGIEKKNNCNFILKCAVLLIAVTLSHLLSSFVITTYGLSIMRGITFAPMFFTRIPAMLIGLFIDAVSVCILYAPLKEAIKKR